MDTSNIILNEPTEEDIQNIEEMLKTNIELDCKHLESEEYKQLFERAKEKFPDMPNELIQMALLSYLENPDMPI